MARFKTAGAIIKQVAQEVGLRNPADPFADADPAFAQLIALANACGAELLEAHEWQTLRREHTFTVTAGNDGTFDLPSDFEYMIPQTGWERSQDVPLFGPTSPQLWAYLMGRGLLSSTIYAQFRLAQGKLYLFPQPAPTGLEVAFEYISNNWILDEDGTTYKDVAEVAADTVLYQPHLFERLLKLRFLEARGFDTTKASDAYMTALETWAGKDKSAPVLRPDGAGHEYPLLDPWRNLPDTGYG